MKMKVAEGRLLSLAWLVLVAVAAAVIPSSAMAHVKWFCISADVTRPPVPLPDVLTPFFLLSCGAFVLLIFAGFVADSWVARRWPALASTGVRLAGVEETLVRLAVAVYFLSLWTNAAPVPWGEGDAMLTPELVHRGPVSGFLQLAVAVLVVRRETCVLAALGIGALYAGAVAVYGVFHMIDYVYFLGLAAYLALTPTASPRALRMRVPVLCGALAFSLMWTAIEKFLYPQWTVAVLLEHPNMTLGFDWPVVVVLAGFVEFSLAFYLATGRGLLRFGAAAFAAVFLSAMPEFGRLDLFGHLPIVAILAVVCIGGASPLQDSWRPRGGGVVAGSAGVTTLFLATLVVMFGMYYGLQRTAGLI